MISWDEPLWSRKSRELGQVTAARDSSRLAVPGWCLCAALQPLFLKLLLAHRAHSKAANDKLEQNTLVLKLKGLTPAVSGRQLWDFLASWSYVLPPCA